ncbi:unnamed protein product [Aphanomyces euteiches]
MDDAHLMPVALFMPAVHPAPEPPFINDTHIMPVAPAMPEVDPDSQIAVDTHTMLAALPMVSVAHGVQQ